MTTTTAWPSPTRDDLHGAVPAADPSEHAALAPGQTLLGKPPVNRGQSKQNDRKLNLVPDLENSVPFPSQV